MILTSKSELENIVEKIKSSKKTIATCNGSYDLFHSGHLAIIKQASIKADYLFVLINSDESIKKYKGTNRPIIDETNRAKIVDSIMGVDYVYLFSETNPIDILKIIKPDFHISSPEYGENTIEKETVEKNGGELIIATWEKGAMSSSSIIKKIKELDKDEKGGIFLDRDGVINVDTGYISNVDDFKFCEGSLAAISALTSAGWDIFIISNQSGVGRNYFTEEDLNNITEYMIDEIEKTGGSIKHVHYCTHHPSDNCECRKPNPQTILKLLDGNNLVARRSYFISDTKNDIKMAKEINMKTIWVKSSLDNPKNKVSIKADFEVDNLKEASNIILGLEVAK